MVGVRARAILPSARVAVGLGSALTACGALVVPIGYFEHDGAAPESGADASAGSADGGPATLSAADGSAASDGSLDASCTAGQMLCGATCVDLQTDPANCGRCGHDCCGGACDGGACQVLILAQSTPPCGKPAVDDSFVTWASGGTSADGAILRVPKRGGAPFTLAPHQSTPWAVAVDADFAYWVTNGNSGDGGVFKVPLDGGAVVAVVPSGEQGASDILLDDVAVYWDDYATGLIRKVNLDGTNLITLAGPSQGVSSPLNMASDTGNVYWPSRFAHTIQKVRKDGSGAVTLAGATDPYGVAVDSSFVYWANYRDSTIAKAPLSGGDGGAIPVATSFSSPTAGANGIVIDQANVFWAIDGPPYGPGPEGYLMVAPIVASGGLGRVYATSPYPYWPTLDSSCLYWTDQTDGALRVVAKP